MLLIFLTHLSASRGGTSLPKLSFGLVDETRVSAGEPIIDGAGRSTLVDHLIESGYRDLTAIDLSATRADHGRGRIGNAAKRVVLDVADVLDFHPGQHFALWHDRAVSHFLTELDDWQATIERACRVPRLAAAFGQRRGPRDAVRHDTTVHRRPAATRALIE